MIWLQRLLITLLSIYVPCVHIYKDENVKIVFVKSQSFQLLVKKIKSLRYYFVSYYDFKVTKL